MIYATSTQFAGEITAFLRHTQLYMFPAFCLGTVLLSQCPSIPPCPPITTYSLSLYIFIDEA